MEWKNLASSEKRPGPQSWANVYGVSSRRRALLLAMPFVESCEMYRILTGRDGKACTSFKGSALSWGLLEDDQEWIKCLEEAVVFKTPVALRQLFVILITEELLDTQSETQY